MIGEVEVWLKPPKDFNPTMHVVGCFCEREGKILLLKRRKGKPHELTFCIPGGKIEGFQSSIDAVISEIKQETGQDLVLSCVYYVHTLYIRDGEMDFVYYVFRATFFREKITIERREHTEYIWVSVGEALNRDLIPGERENIKLAYGLS